MKELPQVYKKNGFSMHLVKCSRNKALYRLEKKFEADNKLHIAGYEIWKLRRYPKGKMSFGKDFGDHLILPSNEDFGEWGWSYQSELQANVAYDLLPE